MFFRSKNAKENDKEGAQPAPVPVQPDKPEPAPGQAALKSSAPAVDAAPTTASADKHLAPDELKKRAEASQRLAAAIGRLFVLMARSPRHRDRKLADLEWLALPAVRTGQCALMEAQSKVHGRVAPVAAVLWAAVSADVDKRLSEKLDEPIRLAPKEWRSGDTLWLIEAIGDDRGIAGLVQQLRAREWQGKPVKARVTDQSGQVQIHLIEPQAAPNGAATAAN
jgi:cytolysin-activating lysine-acyltransferase